MEYVSDFLVGFLTAQLSVAGAPILIREIVGNLFGLACAFLGMKRKGMGLAGRHYRKCLAVYRLPRRSFPHAAKS